MAFTSTLTTTHTVPTQDLLNRYRVWEKVVTFTIDAGDGSAKTAQAVEINGILQKIVAVSGAHDNAETFTLSIDDNSDNEIFTAATPATPAEGATSTWNVHEPLSGTVDVNIDPSDDPATGSWTVTITLRGI